MLIPLIKNKIPFIDVRAPSEFILGAVPTSKNLPILSNNERIEVGKMYKENGNEAAIEKGYSLVNGKIKDKRVSNWTKFVKRNPKAQMYCARGGQRSKIAQNWLKEIGVNIDIVEGGFKALRNTCIEVLDNASSDNKEWIIIAGKTGSGKTKMIKQINNSIDLEGLANHRGSAFGGFETLQPTPVNFENNLAYQYLSISSKKVFIEDESKTIGRLVIPKKFFNKMNSSTLVLIQEPIENRIKNIYNEYVAKEIEQTGEHKVLISLCSKLQKISKRLGGTNYKIVDNLIQDAFQKNDKNIHYEWIKTLLESYYDKMYSYQINQKKDRCIESGTWDEINHFLMSYS